MKRELSKLIAQKVIPVMGVLFLVVNSFLFIVQNQDMKEIGDCYSLPRSELVEAGNTDYPMIPGFEAPVSYESEALKRIEQAEQYQEWRKSYVGEMQLNNASTLTQDVALSFEDFNEYDPLKFYENSMSKVTFWDFYGVESIELGGTIQTDYRGNGFKPVDPAVFTVDFIEPTGKISLNNMGKIKLTQVSMSRANDFQISVPLVVKYKWGELKHEVVVMVKAASGQNRAKSY